MIKHYHKVAWRNLWNNKLFSAINRVGLAVGLAASMMIVLYVFEELSFDKHFQNHDRLYRLVLEKVVNEERTRELFFPLDLPYALKSEFQEIDKFTRIKAYMCQKMRHILSTFSANLETLKVFTNPNALIVNYLYYWHRNRQNTLKVVKYF